MIDLSNAGSRSVFNTVGVDIMSVTTPMSGMMGSAVVELMMSVGGVDVSYSPAKVLNSSTPAITGADVDGIDQVALVVTTADASAADLPANAYGEETE